MRGLITDPPPGAFRAVLLGSRGMDTSAVSEVAWLAATSVALLVVRAVSAALEAALVAVGLPRAQELAAPADARGRARALAALFDEPEATAVTGRVLVTFATVTAGFLAGTAGAALAPAPPLRALFVVVGVALAALVSLVLAAAGRGI